MTFFTRFIKTDFEAWWDWTCAIYPGTMAEWVVADGAVEECDVYEGTQALADQLRSTFPEIVGQTPKLVWGKRRTRL